MRDLFTHPLIRRLLAPERKRIRLSFLAMTGRGLLGLGVPFFFGRTVGLIAERASSREVLISASALVGLALCTAFCQFWMRWLYISASRNFEKRLRDELFAHLMTLSFSYFNRARTGDLMSRLTADVEALRMGIGPGVMHLYQTGIMALGAFLIMFGVSWQLTLLALIPLGLIFLNIRALMPALHATSARVQEQLANVSALAQESFSGARVVKAFAREDYEIERFRAESRRYIDDSMAMTMTRARMHAITEWMSGLVVVAVLWLGGKQVLAGTLTVGIFVSFFGYFMMLIWPMIAIGWTLALFQRAVASLRRLEHVLDERPEIVGGPVEAIQPRGHWRVEDLVFQHEGAAEPTLRGVSFEIPVGGSLAVVGPTGSGKSTLVQVLARLFDPPPGTVLLDGHDVRELDLGTLRRSISMVPQETFLFSDTVRSNIAYADEQADRDDVVAAAEAAQVRDSIERFPHGFDEVIGERGVTLSGGQKQRVAIARALLHDAPTLILDDCLSAVDTGTEELILERLRRSMQGRTTIMVAHRLSSIRHCDRILVLIDGRVAESGTHEELLELGGWYADTWKQQLISRELEAA